MIIIRKTIIILLLVFCAIYVWFNFDFVTSELASILDISNGVNKTEPQDYLSGVTLIFPISSDFNGQRKIEPTPAPIQTPKPAVVVNKPKPTPDTTSVLSSYTLSVPSLGIRAPIVLEPTSDQNKIFKKLESGVVHYAATPLPGQPGTSIILGHSSVYPWYKGNYGHVFSKLSSLKAGDIINIEKDNQILTYAVTRSIIFSPTVENDFELRELETTTGTSLVLMTCWPTGTNSKRIAVRADLII